MHETVEPSAARGPSPLLRARRHFSSCATQTNVGAIIERRCCLSGIASVFSPRASTPRAAESNVGEAIERSATLNAAPLRCSPADVADPAEQTNARRSRQRSRHYCGASIVIPAAELTTNETRTRRGPKICAERQLVFVAQLTPPVEVTM